VWVLLVVFGEPDVEIRRSGDEIEVEVRRVDVYDPTTGEVRSGATETLGPRSTRR
jgi:adenine-specific DNA-methyltransferase